MPSGQGVDRPRNQEAVGGEDELLDPSGEVRDLLMICPCGPNERAIVLPEVLQCLLGIRHGAGLGLGRDRDRRQDTAPRGRARGQLGEADTQEVLSIRQPAFALARQGEVLDPCALDPHVSADGRQGDVVSVGTSRRQARLAVEGQDRIEVVLVPDPVMVVIGEQQGDAQTRQGARASPQKPIDRPDAVLAWRHPDALLDQEIAAGPMPHRHAPVEAKGVDQDMTGRLDATVGPAVGEEGPVSLPVDQRRIELGDLQAASERRIDRRGQESVVAAGQAAGDRARGIAAATVGNPPFAALCALQVSWGVSHGRTLGVVGRVVGRAANSARRSTTASMIRGALRPQSRPCLSGLLR